MSQRYLDPDDDFDRPPPRCDDCGSEPGEAGCEHCTELSYPLDADEDAS